MLSNSFPTPEEVDELIEIFNYELSSKTTPFKHKPRINRTNSFIESQSVMITRKTALEELMEMTGMEEIKDFIMCQVNYNKIMKMRREAGIKTPKRLMHMLLTGNPGTGKTTVARLIGRIYKENGILRSGHLIEANRSSLVGQWIGESERKTSDLIKAAAGGILFIDEIYSLVESDNSQVSNKDFGMKVIDTLMPHLSDPNSDLMVIGAGYKKNIQQFVKANPGLASRFPMVVEFRDFEVSELINIITTELNKSDFKLDDEALADIKSLLNKAIKVKNHGNARLAVTLVNNFLIPNLCNRLAGYADIENIDVARTSIVLKEDVPSFNKLFPLGIDTHSRVGYTH